MGYILSIETEGGSEGGVGGVGGGHCYSMYLRGVGVDHAVVQGKEKGRGRGTTYHQTINKTEGGGGGGGVPRGRRGG